MPLDKAANDLGALWEGTSSKGNQYWSGSLDLAHNPNTARLLANALLSGAKVKVLVFKNNHKNPKAPTHSIVIAQDQLEFLEQNYQTVWRVPPAEQPNYAEYSKNQKYQRKGAQVASEKAQEGTGAAQPTKTPETGDHVSQAPSKTSREVFPEPTEEESENPFGV